MIHDVFFFNSIRPRGIINDQSKYGIELTTWKSAKSIYVHRKAKFSLKFSQEIRSESVYAKDESRRCVGLDYSIARRARSSQATNHNHNELMALIKLF